MSHGDIRKVLKLRIRQNLKEHRTYRIWAGMRNRCWRMQTKGMSIQQALQKGV